MNFGWILCGHEKTASQTAASRLWALPAVVSSSDDAQLQQPDEWVICQSEFKYLSTQIKYDTVWDESDLHAVKRHVFTRVRDWFKDNQVDNEAMTEYSFNHGSVWVFFFCLFFATSSESIAKNQHPFGQNSMTHF